MKVPIWPSTKLATRIHDEQLYWHGGLPGLRDGNALESALAAPRNLFAYEGVTSIHRLATTYASRICQNHPFVDGNKRTAWLACYTFSSLNKVELALPEHEVVLHMLMLAESRQNENSFCEWLWRSRG